MQALQELQESLTENDFEKTSTQKIKRDFLKNLDINDYTLAN